MARRIWREELLPHFQYILQSNDQPRDGNIYVMYHGTTVEAAKQILLHGFMQSADGMLGSGVYVSRDIGKAARYPLGDKSKQVILKLSVNVGKVIKIDCQGHPLQKIWHYCGYDTAWVPASCDMVPSQLEEDCIWDPERIKVVQIAYIPDQQLLFELYPYILKYVIRDTIITEFYKTLNFPELFWRYGVYFG
ncbi:hypothetical protein XENTR_v10018818 [Xenopus tropicalis]|uniref:PARP catalytic domain-containing protein n=2 Tax=Xenopus tropicalis TaxID=8364 RepID=A0A803K007_XENTR|nr:hypothetical protein XENTR_v10018818 [Xenopus tropicalis]